MQPDTDTLTLLFVERAAHDLRKGFPVILADSQHRTLLFSPEATNRQWLAEISASHQGSLILTAKRFAHLFPALPVTDSAVALPFTDEACQFSGLHDNTPATPPAYAPASALETAALQLARIAELLPCVIAFPESAIAPALPCITVTCDNLMRYQDASSLTLTEACQTPLVLRHNIPAHIHAFRPSLGGKEHYAIIIGTPGATPLVRVHSSCYTGDLLDSLACDCHDQLHSAIDLMHQQGGGIILYMLQEGRGIGLINKLRAYALKEQGLDTVDANEALGFDDDERLFQPAAQMLKKLGIAGIKLLTNNPKKARGLEECGIRVLECVPHVMETNVHNEQYLQTKAERLGHVFKQD